MRLRLLLLLLTLCGSAVITGCIDIDIAIAIRGSGAVRMDIVYTIDNEFAQFGAAEFSEIGVLPIAERDFQAMVAAHDGVHLRRYRQRETKTHRIISVRLRFDSYVAFNDFFAAGANRDTATSARITGHGQSGEIVFPIADALAANNDQSLELQFYAEFFADNHIQMQIVTPRRIASTAHGMPRGAQVAQQYSLAELAAADTDIIWRVAW